MLPSWLNITQCKLRYLLLLCAAVFIAFAQANNIQVGNVTLTGRDMSAGANNASNFIKVKFNLSWENSWRRNSSADGLSHIGVISGGSGYTSAPAVSISGGGGASATATISGGKVTGVTITNAGAGYTTLPTISFSGGGGSGAVATAYNKTWFDAAWVFVKFRVSGGEWQHASLNDTFHTMPAGAAVYMGLRDFSATHNATSNPAVGAFIYRSVDGSGTNTFNNIELRWNYGRNGVNDDANVDIRVYAVEMVYVPRGEFAAGDGETTFGSTRACFRNGSSSSPLQITGEGALVLGGTTAGNLANNMPTSSQLNPIDDFSSSSTQNLSSSFPKGFNAFYCMKYEISQGQYRDFLNTLNYTQQAARTAVAPNSAAGTGALSSSNANRNGIDIQTAGVSTTTPAVYACNLDGDANYNETTDGQFIACNFLTWPHVAAYLDWSGLRPMSEMEFEKAGRGMLSAVTGEFAWGNTGSTTAANITNSGGANESCTTTGANCVRDNNGSVQGPMRVGVFATSGSNRSESGASYWGILELSGNVFERAASLGSSAGRSFTGAHGDGSLSSGGHANETNWPGLVSGLVTAETGAGLRGSSWFYSGDHRISSRAYANVISTDFKDLGGRGVRSAPGIGIGSGMGGL